MSIRSRGFVAAMEDDTPEVEINIGTEVPAEVEAQAAEVAEDAADITDETQAMEDAVADAETLDMIADTAEQSVEEGEGMDPVAAEIAEVAVESIYARLGVTRKALPSMESFGSAGSRKSATRIAVEDWKETVKKVWEAVKKFFVGLWDKIKVLFEKFLNLFRSLEKAALAMKKRAEAISGEAKEKTFKNEGLVKGLGRGTGKLTATEAMQLLDTSTGAMEKTGLLADRLGTTTEAIGQIIASSKMSEDESKAALKAAMEKAKEVKIIGEKLYDNTNVTVTTEGTSIVVEVKAEESKGEECHTLTKDEMMKICDEVVKVSKAAAASKKILSASEKLMKAASATASKVASAVSGDKEENKQQFVKEAASAIVKSGSAVSKAQTSVISLTTKAGKASLKYVEASMKQYGAEKKEEKKD